MTFDDYKKLDEYQREQFLNANGIEISVKHAQGRHSYAIIDTPDKIYIAVDRSSMFEYLELIYLLYYNDNTNKDKLLRLLEKAKKDLNMKLYYCNCRNIDEINKRSEHKYNDVLTQIQCIRKLENKLQKLFEQESYEFLEKFKYEIITKHNLYHIKYGLQHILRSYQNNNFIKVKSFRNELSISQSIVDFDVEID